MKVGQPTTVAGEKPGAGARRARKHGWGGTYAGPFPCRPQMFRARSRPRTLRSRGPRSARPWPSSRARSRFVTYREPTPFRIH